MDKLRDNYHNYNTKAGFHPGTPPINMEVGHVFPEDLFLYNRFIFHLSTPQIICLFNQTSHRIYRPDQAPMPSPCRSRNGRRPLSLIVAPLASDQRFAWEGARHRNSVGV